MRTEELIAALSADTLPRPGIGGRMARALVPALGVSLAALVMLWSLRPDLASALASPALAKTLGPALLALIALGLARALSTPGARGQAQRRLVAAAGVVAGLAVVWGLVQGGLGALTMHAGKLTLLTCIVSIPVLSALPLAAILWALRQGAPASPTAAGAAGGLMAGALGAAVYSLHCTEDALLFYVPAYGTMILLIAGLGALLGSRLLRW